MKEVFIEKDLMIDAYHEALIKLTEEGTIIDCPDYDQKQLECSMTIVIKKPLEEPRISKMLICGPKELRQYEFEMVDGIFDFIVGKNEKVWEYTYHERYAYQLDFIIQELKREPNSRRAIMSIRNFEVDSKTTHPACLQSIQYFIRDDKLDCIILFRSNDLPEAFFMNAFALIKLQEKVASELGVEVGSYTHRSNSMHAYEKNFDLLKGYVDKIRGAEDIDDISYDYEEDFKDMMEEYDDEIMETVRQKREQYGEL